VGGVGVFGRDYYCGGYLVVGVEVEEFGPFRLRFSGWVCGWMRM
jgi:hypothetical protein